MLSERKEPFMEKDNERCICCGEIIPDGAVACPNCLVYVKEEA
jgi:hypothetical protein